MIYNKKNKAIMVRMTEDDFEKLNALCEVYNIDRCKLIRIFINTASVKAIERKLEDYETIEKLS